MILFIPAIIQISIFIKQNRKDIDECLLEIKMIDEELNKLNKDKK